MEIELKLAARAADLPDLERMLVGMAAASAKSTKRLIGTYYDTQDRALQRRRMILRIREEAGRLIQTVKSGDPTGSDFLARGEWEDVVSDKYPDPFAPESGRHLPEGIAGDLRPLFVTDVTRLAVEIEPSPATRIEAAIDDGEIRTLGATRVEPICEVELELKSGNVGALYDLALQLLKVAPLRPETRSKAERGYRLMEDAAAPAPVHAGPVSLDAAMTSAAALQSICRSCLGHLLGNEEAALAGQPEGIHQMRVAVRRIRSALSCFKSMLPDEEGPWMSDGLSGLAGALGPARNFDVLATELLPPARSALPEEPGWDELGAAIERARHEAHGRVREEILSTRHTSTMLRLLRRFTQTEGPDHAATEPAALPSHPIGEIAPRLLEHRFLRLRQRSKGFSQMGPRQRHKVRIAVKRLRYGIELLGGLSDQDELQRFVKRLKRLQDDLGYANDVRVAHDLVSKLCEEAGPESSGARAGTRLLEWHERVLAEREGKLREHLRRLKAATPFWRH